jgi:hypothetical protein
LKKLIPTFVILTLLAAGYGYAHSQGLFGSSHKEHDVLLSLETGQVQAFRLVHGEEQTDMERSAGGWSVKANPSYPLDQKSVDQWLVELSGLAHEGMVIEETGDYAEFGLDPSVHEVSLTEGDGTSQTILVGNELPIRGHRYLKYAAAPAIYKMNNEKIEALTHSLLHFTDRRVMPYDLTKIHAVEAVMADKYWRLERQGDAKASYDAPWKLGGQTKAYLEISSILGQIIHMETEEQLLSVSDLKMTDVHIQFIVEEFVGGQLVKHTIVGEVQDEEHVLLWKMGAYWGYVIDMEDINELFRTALKTSE